jgi:hypothetical protein
MIIQYWFHNSYDMREIKENISGDHPHLSKEKVEAIAEEIYFKTQEVEVKFDFDEATGKIISSTPTFK